MEKRALYKLHFDCGRMGELTGIFIADKEIIKWLEESGLQVHFGEVLGKHSDVCGPLESVDYSFVTDDPTVLDLFDTYDLSTGFNPLHYTLFGTEDLLSDDYEDDLNAYDVYGKLQKT